MDTGNTLSCLIAHLEKKGASSISVCTFLDKPARRKVNVQLVGDGKFYSGFEAQIPSSFNIILYGTHTSFEYKYCYQNVTLLHSIEQTIFATSERCKLDSYIVLFSGNKFSTEKSRTLSYPLCKANLLSFLFSAQTALLLAMVWIMQSSTGTCLMLEFSSPRCTKRIEAIRLERALAAFAGGQFCLTLYKKEAENLLIYLFFPPWSSGKLQPPRF